MQWHAAPLRLGSHCGKALRLPLLALVLLLGTWFVFRSIYLAYENGTPASQLLLAGRGSVRLPADHSVYRALDIVTAALDREGIEYSLYRGTLLGAWRHGGVVPIGDRENDVDLAVFETNSTRIQAIIDEIGFQAGYSDFGFHLNYLHNLTADQIARESYYYIDLWQFTSKNGNSWCVGYNQQCYHHFKPFNHPDGRIPTYPDAWIRPARKIQFGPHRYSVPATYHALDEAYGPAWLNVCGCEPPGEVLHSLGSWFNFWNCGAYKGAGGSGTILYEEKAPSGLYCTDWTLASFYFLEDCEASLTRPSTRGRHTGHPNTSARCMPERMDVPGAKDLSICYETSEGQTWGTEWEGPSKCHGAHNDVVCRGSPPECHKTTAGFT